MPRDFSHHEDKNTVTWLLRCYISDNGASGLELEGKEAKQLGSLSREAALGRVIEKRKNPAASGGNS